jgi:hypothetical protein
MKNYNRIGVLALLLQDSSASANQDYMGGLASKLSNLAFISFEKNTQ